MRSTMACCREWFCPKCRASGGSDFATRCSEGEKAGDHAGMRHIELDVVVVLELQIRVRVRVTLL